MQIGEQLHHHARHGVGHFGQIAQFGDATAADPCLDRGNLGIQRGPPFVIGGREREAAQRQCIMADVNRFLVARQ